MTEAKLSQLYSYCTIEIQRLTTELYEQLHEPEGIPDGNYEETLENVRKYKRLIVLELEAIKHAVREFNNHDDGKQLQK